MTGSATPPRRPTAADQAIARLICGLLLLALAGCVGLVASSFLLMGTDSCMADPTKGACSPTTQWWIAYLPVAGAGTGIVVAAAIGVVRARRGKDVSPGLAVGWLMFVVAEIICLGLLRS